MICIYTEKMADVGEVDAVVVAVTFLRFMRKSRKNVVAVHGCTT